MKMKTLFFNISMVIFVIISLPILNFAQAPRLGILSSFVVYTTAGAITSSGATQLTGNVGNKDAGAITGLSAANVNGTIYNAVDSVTTQCAADLQLAYNQLSAQPATKLHPAPVFGNGEILTPGVYNQGGAGSVNGNLVLDAQSDTTAVFIIKINGAFSSSSGSSMSFLNGASPCNIFWLIEGALSMGTFSALKGTYIVNNAAITIAAGCSIEGRIISTTGAITFDGLTGAINRGCVANYWTGAAGTADWFNNLNWTASVPDGIGTTLIPSRLVGANLYPVIANGVVTVNNLTIENPGRLMLNTAKLQINGALLNAGYLDASNATIEMKGFFPQNLPANAFNNDNVKNLLLNNNVHINGNINITGNLNFGGNNDTLFTGGFLTLKSNNTGTGRIPDITNAGINFGNAISGQVTIERYIPAKRAWRLLSVPISPIASPTINTAWQEGVTSGNPLPGYGTHITGGSMVNGFDAILNDSSSIKIFDNAANSFVDIPALTGTNAEIANYPAYFLFVRGDRNTDLLAGENAAVSNTTLRIKGNIFTDSVSTTINAQNFTVAANPFPSTIDFHAVDKNNVNDKLYVWDPKLGGTKGVGGYVTLLWDGVTYDVTAATSVVSQFIPSGAAFLVETLDGNNPGILKFKESNKRDSASDFTFRPMLITEKMSINLLSVNPDNTTSVLDGVITTYNDQSSNDVDRSDALKIINPSENIGIVRNGIELAIERRFTIQNKDTIFFKLNSLKMQDYKLQINTQGMATTGLTAMLRDNYSAANNNTPLNINGLTDVVFTANADAASTDPNRFGIVLALPTPTPVKFYQINAVVVQKNILLSFKTATETGIRFYEIQTSSDGFDFNTIAKITAIANNGGNAVDSWLHVNAAVVDGVHYYRIKSVEITDHSDYSIIVKVVVNTASIQSGIAVYGSASNEASVRVQFNNIDKGKYALKLYNFTGQLIQSASINYIGGNNFIYNFIINNKFAAGTYQIQLFNRSNKFTTSFLRN